MAIRFYNNDTTYLPPHRNNIKKWLQACITEEGYRLDSAQFIFCSDEALLQMNRDYLQHDYYTDIITFDLRESNQKQVVNGEMYISIDRVRDNAQSLHTPTIDELHRVMIHGILHLMGYGDKSKKEIAVMRSKEDYYLAKRIKNA